MNVRMKLDGQYQFSVSQEMDDDGLVEVALFYNTSFVPCNLWAMTMMSFVSWMPLTY